MPPNFQTKDYSYISQAGNQISQGLSQIPSVMKEEDRIKNLKVDINSAEKARQDRIVEAAGEYLDATGESGPEAERKAYAAAAKRYTVITGEERNNPSLAIQRWNSMDNEWYKNTIPELKKKRYFQETGSSRQAVEYNRPSQGIVQAGSPTGGESGGTPSRMPRSLQDIQNQELYSPPTVTSVEVPPEITPEQRYQKAQDYGIYNQPEVQADIAYASQAGLSGMRFPQGTTRGEVARAAAEHPAYTEPMKDIVQSYPTEKDVMTNERLKASAEAKNALYQQKLKIDGLKAATQSRKLTSDERREILANKAKNDTARLQLEIQIKAIKAGLAKSNKDIVGVVDQSGLESSYQELESLQNQLYTIDENSREFDDLLKEKGGINSPKPSGGTPGKPSAGGFQAWLKSKGQ